MSEREAVLSEVEARVRIAERQGWANRSVPVRLLRQIAEELRNLEASFAAHCIQCPQCHETILQVVVPRSPAREGKEEEDHARSDQSG